MSFLTKKSGYGFLPSPEAIVGASSRSGAYVGSVRQRNLRTKRNSLHDAKPEELHSAGAVRAKPFRRANCFRPHNLSSKGCNNEHTCLLFATPRQKKMPGRGEAHSRARHRFLIGNRLGREPLAATKDPTSFSSLEQNHGADQRCCKQGGLTIFSKEENSQKIFSLPNSLARTGFFQKPVYGVRTCSHHPSRNIILCICI